LWYNLLKYGWAGGIMKRSKLNKVILLAIVFSFVFTVAAEAVVFTDISNHWAKSYIERVADKGLVSGYDDKTFKPDNNVTVLEALVMLSRLYDIDKDIKDEIIAKYKPVLKNMPNTLYNEWSFDYLSVIMELGIVSENGMNDMFQKKTIFNDAKREEIAVLLTKAMMLGEEAQSLKVYTLPFADAEKISTAARPYIYIMYDKGILQGDSMKNINPANKITRAELATLLDKAYNYIEKNDVYPDLDDYVPTKVVKGIITELSAEKTESYMYIEDNGGVESIVRINDDTKIYINGKTKKFADLKEDMLVECKIDENRLAVKVEVDSKKEVVRGTINLVSFVEPAKITITDKNKNKLTYNVPSDIDIYLDGEETTLKKLKEKDEIILILDDDEVIQINSESRIKQFDGVITSINYSSYPIKITMKTKAGVSKTFTFSSDVEVTRNDEESSFDRLRVGDEVTITTRYNEMTSINTIAKEAELTGTIKEILIGSTNKIKLALENGETKQYVVSSNAIISIGSTKASIYDLRIGYNVNVNTSGDEIVSIETSKLDTAVSFSGKVIYLNLDEKLIMMQNVTNGQTEIVNVRTTSNTKVFNTLGNAKALKDIVEGESIMCMAISQGGEYVAVSIMIK
jgi:hypothetical protein